MRIAYFTSLNPQQSGVSDHSEEFLPYLAQYADIDVIISGSYTPTNKAFCDKFRIVHYEEYLHDPAVYDVAVYQVGNNFRFHAYMIPCLRAAPGIVVLQDYCLQYLVLGLTLGRGDLGALKDALQPVYGQRAGTLVHRLLLGLENPGSLTFAHPFLAAGRGLIIPSRHLLELVHQQIPGKPIKYIAIGVATQPLNETKLELRQRYGYREDEFIIASVSTLAPKKRLDVLLKALRKVRDRIHNPRLVVVGTGSPGASIHRLIREYGLSDIVELTGWVEPDHYQHLIQLSDIAVDMRDMTAAETAHSVLRCLRVGKPAIVSARGTFLELPDACCPKIELDERQENTLANLLVELSSNPEKMRTMETAALAYANEYLGLDLQAREFMSFINEVVDSTPGGGPVELLEPRPGRAKGVLAMLYKATRIVVLVRSYGFTDSLRRLRVILSNRFKAEDTGDL